MSLRKHKTFLSYTLLISCIFLSSQVFKISILELTALRSSEKFGDLRLVLNWASCYQEISDIVYQTFNPTIPCSGYIYGGLLLPLILLLKISTSMTNVFGYIFCVLVATNFGYLGYFGGKKKVFISLLIISPSVALLIDRANFDVLIVFIVLLSAILFSKNHEKSSMVLIGITVLIKFYTLPLLIFIVLLTRSALSRLIGSVIVLATGFQVVIDLSKISTGFPSGYFAKFGFSVWSLYSEKVPVLKSWNTISRISSVLVGIVIFLALLTLKKRVEELKWDYRSLTPIQTLTIWNLVVHISCCLAGMSYDYRLLFIITAAIGYLRDSELTIQSFEKYAVALMLLLSCWVTFLVPVIAPIGDFALESLTFWLVIRISFPIISSVRSRNA